MKSMKLFSRSFIKLSLVLTILICTAFICDANSRIGAKNTDSPGAGNVSPLELQLIPAVFPNGFNVSCFGFKDGSIDLTVSGGLPPYTYKWSNGEATEDIHHLPVGYYDVTVKDATGQTAIAKITLTGPEQGMKPVISSILSQYSGGYNVSCFECYNGSISLYITQGSGVYNFKWSDGATTQNRYLLGKGVYSVDITDASACGNNETYSRTFELKAPDRSDWTMTGNSNTNPPLQFVGTNDNKDLVFKTNSTERLRISPSGNIGINTIDPTEKLTVTGNGKISENFTVGKKMEVLGSLKIDSLAGVGFKPDSNSNKSYRMMFVDEAGNLIADPSIVGRCTQESGIPWMIGGNPNLGNESFNFIGTCSERPFKIFTFNHERMRITPDGNVGIGTTAPTQKLEVNGNILCNGNISIGIAVHDDFKLAVDGKIICEEVKVQLSDEWVWPDYVFDENYLIMPISELESFLSANKHLPNVPSSKEVSNNGINIGEMNSILLQKIEELTLYIIDLNKKYEDLQQKVEQNANVGK